MKEIYRRVKDKGLTVTHVCEVGVYLPETSNIIDFIRDHTRATLVEADPETVEKIRQAFDGYDITLHPYAVWDSGGSILLSRAGASTFASGLPSSPALENDNFNIGGNDSFEAECRVFSELDDGTIELLSVDVEGCEWYVIKHLKSRPKVISLETHGKYYTNPFISEIRLWMKHNGYSPWYMDGSDTVYVHSSALSPSFADRLRLKISGMKILLKKQKRILRTVK